MIYYFCPDENRPCGGVKQIYRQVGILHKHGIEACVLHSMKGFRCDWFEGDVPIRDLGFGKMRTFLSKVSKRIFRLCGLGPSLRPGRRVLSRENGTFVTRFLEKNDVLVLPEFLWKPLKDRVHGLPIVLFVQGLRCLYGACEFLDVDRGTDFLSSQVKGALAISDYEQQMIAMLYKSLPLFRIHNAVDPAIFHPEEPKKKQIALMPRRLKEDLLIVVHALAVKGLLKHWKVVVIDNLSEAEAARVLRDSAIFLSSSDREGFGLPPLEAGACGCVVVGYDGVAGREFFSKEYMYPVPQGDILAFIETLQAVLAQYDEDPVTLEQKAHEFAGWIAAEYSLEREEKEVLAAWHSLLPLCQGRPNQQ